MAKTILVQPPFGILVGPTKDVSWRDSLVAFITLYHRFTRNVLKTMEEFKVMIDTVNDAAGVPRGTFEAAVAAVVQKDYRQALQQALRDNERQVGMSALVAALRARQPSR